MIVPGKPGWTVDGTVLVWEARAWVRTDLMLDLGPYPVRQRRAMIGAKPYSWLGNKQVEEMSPPLWVRSIALDHAGPTFGGWQARVAAYGWPWPVLYWLWDWRSESLHGGAALDDKSPRSARPKVPEQALPWQFVWSGLAVDSIFYGAAFLGITLVLRWLRSALRRRRGLCPTCAYDLRATPPGSPCPECGTPTRIP
jgi:hypothetical protein